MGHLPCINPNVLVNKTCLLLCYRSLLIGPLNKCASHKHHTIIVLCYKLYYHVCWDISYTNKKLVREFPFSLFFCFILSVGRQFFIVNPFRNHLQKSISVCWPNTHAKLLFTLPCYHSSMLNWFYHRHFE